MPDIERIAKKIAVIWSRMGPYHLARLKGAATTGSNNEIIGIEVAEMDSEYEWALVRGRDRFARKTVFSGKDYHHLTSRTIAAGISAMLDDLKPDTVAINGWSVPEARAALAWANQRKAGSILMSETKIDDAKRVWWKELPKRRLLKNFGSALVGGTEQKQYLIDLGMPAEAIRLGYDAIDNDHFSNGRKTIESNRDEWRNRFALPDNYFFVCTRFLRRKNVDGLLHAYALYRTLSSNPWSLVIAGNGMELSRLRAIEAEHRLDGVRWLGFVQYDQLPIYYALANAFVHPAKSEAWGLVVNEAASSGLPLLVSETVGARYELVDDGNNGFLFCPFSVNSMCSSLVRIAQRTREEREKMGVVSSSIVQNWGPERFGKELIFAAEIANKSVRRDGAHI